MIGLWYSLVSQDKTKYLLVPALATFKENINW